MRLFESEGVPVRVRPRAPNLDAVAERWVRAVTQECPAPIIVLGKAHLRYILPQYMARHEVERPHQGWATSHQAARTRSKGRVSSPVRSTVPRAPRLLIHSTSRVA